MNKMNPHTNLASFYRYFYLTKDLPNNLCNYFWGLIFAMICFPFVWMAMAINRVNNKISYVFDTYAHFENGEFIEHRKRYYYRVGFNPISTGIGILFTFMTVIIGLCTSKVLISIFIIAQLGVISSLQVVLITMYFIGVISIGAAIGLFHGIMALIRLIPNKPLSDEERHQKRMKELEENHKRKLYREANPSFLTLTWRWVVSFKQKNCPIITWDYENKTSEEFDKG